MKNVGSGFKQKKLLKYLDIKIQISLLENMLIRRINIKGPSKRRGVYKLVFFINESGFYSLVLSSKLETAKYFRKWVTSKVLPSIRKYGFYKTVDLKIKQRFIFKGKKCYKHPAFNNYAANKKGDILSLKSEKILKMFNNGTGYLFFSIHDKKLEKPINYYQHRFVYEVFRGPIPRFFEVDHINDTKNDNRIKNLQLLTPKKNIEKSKNKPIISTRIENGEKRKFISIKKAAIILDINADYISKICRKKHKTATSKKNGHKYTFKFLD